MFQSNTDTSHTLKKRSSSAESSSHRSDSSHNSASATHSRATSFQPLGDLFSQFQVKDTGKYISQEFQDFGYRLAIDLQDLKHKSLYIKMAKDEDRAILERARSFVLDADTAKSKARLFMWKVKELKKEKAERLLKKTKAEKSKKSKK